MESFGDKSQSRSPSNASSSLGSGDRNCSNRYFRKSRKYRSSSSDSSNESISRKSRKRINNKNNSENSNSNKSKKKNNNNKQSGDNSRKNETRNNSRKSGKSKNVSNKEALLREVRIVEHNENGEEEEIITHVRVASITLRKRRRTKRRKVF